MQENKVFRRELNVKWIKAPSRNTYLCPMDALDRLDAPKEDELKLICIYESENPQND